MPLSPPVSRVHKHTREVKCFGYEREDGLWDIEGRITDIKTYSFENKDRGLIASGTPVHDMVVRITVDEELVIHDIEAATESGPFNICPNIIENLQSLKGLKIAPGWGRQVNKKIGGILGCTHINQLLLGPLATAAYQTLVPRWVANGKTKKPDTRPSIIDTCHAFASDGDFVKREWPAFYTGD